jgi:uncharacterized BrkB/YihY/UPF0761 family membrane protein
LCCWHFQSARSGSPLRSTCPPDRLLGNADPGALLVGFGFQLLHGFVVYLLGPKLEKATCLYGGIGIATTILFFLWIVARIIITAPILNHAIFDSRNRAEPKSPETSAR